MTIAFSEGKIDGYHKSGMVSLTDIFKVGNVHRAKDGKTASNITRFLQSANTGGFMQVISENQGIDVDKILVKVGRGKSARTFCNIHFAVYAAEYLSPQFHYEVIDKFINGEVFKLRDDGGNEFKTLNMFIDEYLPERENKPNNKGIHINCAKMLRLGILGEGAKTEDWNKATNEQLRERYECEHALCNLLKLGVVNNWEHMKSLILKLQLN